MRRKILFTGMLLMALAAGSIQAQAALENSIDTTLRFKWKVDAKPLDIVHTLDNKRVFILGDDSRVHVYSADGKKQGSIDVDKGVTAIDIAPRGENLYLINDQENTFSSLTVSFNAMIDITGAPFLGKEDAPVTMAIFSDFQ